MKKILIVGILAFAMIASAGLVSAGTTVDTFWNGVGIFDTHFNAGDDATSDFWTSGNAISGEWHTTVTPNTQYPYMNVDSVTTEVKSSVGNGFMKYKFTRDDSYGSYGPAGQESYTFIDTVGTGDFAWRSTSNYASLKSCNYGWQASGQMQATGNQEIIHTFGTVSEWAGIHVLADATTSISDMSETSNSGGYTFGKGCGCYTNANVDITGSGTFDLSAYADNSITTQTGGITTDGFLNIHSAFNNGFHYNNFALSGN